MTDPNEMPKYFPITDQIIQKAMKSLDEGVVSDDKRERTSAINTLKDIMSIHQRQNEFNDKTARLDEGRPTDITRSLDQFQAHIDEKLDSFNARGDDGAEESEVAGD